MQANEENLSKLEKYANALTTLTYFVNKELVSEITARPETEFKEPYRFFYTILVKSNGCLDTCSLLLCNYYSRPHHADSLAIILRSLITDCVIYRYLLDQSRHNESDLVDNISSIYFNHVDFTVKGIKGFYKNIYDWSDKEVSDAIYKIKSSRPNYYDSDGRIKVKQLSTSVRYILKDMASSRQPGDKEDLQTLYHHYDILSKYEHPGEFSFQLVHRQYLEKTREAFLSEMIDAINNAIIPTVISVIGLWPDLAKQKLTKFNDLFKVLLQSYEPSAHEK